MRGRIDHTVPRAKLNQQPPVRFLYRLGRQERPGGIAHHAPDRAPGYANADVEIGGYMDERTVTLPFAAMAMGSIPDDELMVPDPPCGRRLPGGLLTLNRIPDRRRTGSSANWTLQADPVLRTAPTDLSNYPKCYFQWPGGRNIMDVPLAKRSTWPRASART